MKITVCDCCGMENPPTYKDSRVTMCCITEGGFYDVGIKGKGSNGKTTNTTSLGSVIDKITKPKWISVKNRLPDVGERVIYASYDYMNMYYVIESEYDRDEGDGVYNWLEVCNDKYRINTSYYWDTNYITHWMPIPKLPNEV